MTSGLRVAACARPSSAVSASTSAIAVARRARAQEAPHLRLVLDQEDERGRRGHAPALGVWRSDAGFVGLRRRAGDRQREPEDGAAAGPVLAPRSARRARRRSPRQMARPRPTPPRRAAAAVELLENTLLLTGRQTRAPVRHVRDHLTGPARGPDLDRGARRRVLRGVLEQVDEHLLQQDLVHRHQREVGGNDGRDRMAAQLVLGAEQRHARPRRTAAAIPSGPAALRPPPGSCRAGWQRAGPSAGTPARCVAARSRRAAGDGLGVLEQGARRALDGRQRRPHVVRQRAQRARCAGARPPPPLRTLGCARPAPARSSAAAVWPASDSSRRRRAGSPELGRVGEREAENTDHRSRRFERKVQRGGSRQRRRAPTGRLAVVEGPLRDGALAIVEGVGRRADDRHRAGVARKEDGGIEGEGVPQALRAPRPGPPSGRAASARSRLNPYSAEVRCSRSRAASAWLRIRPVRFPSTSATTSMTPKVST